jgi:hypothetical protein
MLWLGQQRVKYLNISVLKVFFFDFDINLIITTSRKRKKTAPLGGLRKLNV